MPRHSVELSKNGSVRRYNKDGICHTQADRVSVVDYTVIGEDSGRAETRDDHLREYETVSLTQRPDRDA